MPAEQVVKFGKGCRECVTGHVWCTSLFWVWAWAVEGKDSWGKFGQEASEMGLGRGLQRIPFCDDQGLQDLDLLQVVGAALKEWGRRRPNL